jgi:hypothetical protein
VLVDLGAQLRGRGRPGRLLRDEAAEGVVREVGGGGVATE